MSNTAKIYGYNFTRENIFSSFKIIPEYSNSQVVNELADDSNQYHLTGTLEIDLANICNIDNFIFIIQEILSFIDQRDVLIIKDKGENDLPKSLVGYRRNGSGEVVGKDCLFSNSRTLFIEKCYQALTNNSDPNLEIFRSSFFKVLEVFRARKDFIEITYFLLFSALESLSRAVLNDLDTKNSAVPIAKLLQQYGFDIKQDNHSQPIKAVSSYAHVRNALFHNAFFQVQKNINGTAIDFKITDYISPLNRLLPLVIMKYIQFDDNHINWNCWLDRQPFK